MGKGNGEPVIKKQQKHYMHLSCLGLISLIKIK